MRKNFLLINISLIILIIVLYFVLSTKLSNDVTLSLGNLRKNFKEKGINVWDTYFEEVSINSLKSFNIRNFHFDFDYPTNNFKLNLSLKVDNISVSWPDFSAKEITIKASGVRLKYLDSDNISRGNWIYDNYPFVGLQGSNFEVNFKNDQQNIRKTIETNLQELFELLEKGRTKSNFTFEGKLKFDQNDFPIKILKDNENYYSLSVDFDKLISNIKYLQFDKSNLKSFKDYIDCVYVLDLENYLSRELENVLKTKNDFPIDVYSQVLTGFILQLYFKEEYVAKFIESRIKTNGFGPQNLFDMNLNNFKVGVSYADSSVKEDDLKRLIFEDKKILLRPSNFSIKIK